jgi:hypothetical protein
MDFEVKQNGKTVPFRFTFGKYNLEMIPYLSVFNVDSTFIFWLQQNNGAKQFLYLYFGFIQEEISYQNNKLTYENYIDIYRNKLKKIILEVDIITSNISFLQVVSWA